MNAVLMLMYNTTPPQLDLTKEAYESVLSQDIGPMHIWLIDNGSDAATHQWVDSLHSPVPHRLTVGHNRENVSPVKVVNKACLTLFSLGYRSVLGVPNDAILPTNLYSELEKCPRGFVAAFMNEERDKVAPCTDARLVHEDPHTSVMLTRKWAHDALVAKDGYFLDEGYSFYANDCDLKLRMASCGIRGAQMDIQCYHYSGASHRMGDPAVARSIYAQADIDRDYFSRKYGFPVGSQEHVDAMTNINFRAESKIRS